MHIMAFNISKSRLFDQLQNHKIESNLTFWRSGFLTQVFADLEEKSRMCCMLVLEL